MISIVDVLQSSHIQRRGAVLTIRKLAEHFGDDLFTTLPNLWASIVQPLEDLPEHCGNGMLMILIKYLTLSVCVYPVLSEQAVTSVVAVLHALQVFEIIIPVVPGSLQAQVKMIVYC